MTSSLQHRTPSRLQLSEVERLLLGLARPQSLSTRASADEQPLLSFSRLNNGVQSEPVAYANKMSSFVSALHSQQNTLISWVRGRPDEGGLSFSLASDGRSHLTSCVNAFLPGVSLSGLNARQSTQFTERVGEQAHCAVLTGVPFEDARAPSLHGLISALDALSGQSFDLVVCATPTDPQAIAREEELLGQLYQRLSTQLSATRHHERNHSVNINQSEREDFTRSNDDSHTEDSSSDQSWNTKNGEQQSQTHDGHSQSDSSSWGHSQSERDSRSWRDSTSHKHSDATSRNASASHSQRVTLSTQIAHWEVKDMLEQVTYRLQRLRRSRGQGVWRTSVFLCAPSERALSVMCSLLKGAIGSTHGLIEPIQTTPISNPRRAIAQLSEGDRPQDEHGHFNSSLTSEELAILIRPPINELPGFPVRQPLAFGIHLPSTFSAQDNTIGLGHLVIRGRHMQQTPIGLPTSLLPSHTLIVGTTGSGKTTTTRRLLCGLVDEGIPFLVIEPAKSEYGDLITQLEQTGDRPLRLVAGAEDHTAFRFNPLQVPEGMVIGRHVESVIGLLKANFPMEASLPQVLERVVLLAYERAGLRLTDVWTAKSPACPTFQDLLAEQPRKAPASKMLRNKPFLLIDEALDGLDYHSQIKGSLRAAIMVRIESLTSGLKGAVFNCTRESQTNLKSLLTRSAFLDLRRISDPGSRRILMASLIRTICELQEVEAERSHGLHGKTRHVCVLEEAHHVFRRVEGSGAQAELQRLSNQVLADAFSEVRAYGQAFVVIDQSPTLLDNSVIRNTNTKIIHRLLYAQDCRAVGDAMGMSPEEQITLRRLSAGECLLFATGLDRPVHLKVHPTQTRSST